MLPETASDSDKAGILSRIKGLRATCRGVEVVRTHIDGIDQSDPIRRRKRFKKPRSAKPPSIKPLAIGAGFHYPSVSVPRKIFVEISVWSAEWAANVSQTVISIFRDKKAEPRGGIHTIWVFVSSAAFAWLIRMKADSLRSYFNIASTSHGAADSKDARRSPVLEYCGKVDDTPRFKSSMQWLEEQLRPLLQRDLPERSHYIWLWKKWPHQSANGLQQLGSSLGVVIEPRDWPPKCRFGIGEDYYSMRLTIIGRNRDSIMRASEQLGHALSVSSAAGSTPPAIDVKMQQLDARRGSEVLQFVLQIALEQLSLLEQLKIQIIIGMPNMDEQMVYGLVPHNRILTSSLQHLCDTGYVKGTGKGRATLSAHFQPPLDAVQLRHPQNPFESSVFFEKPVGPVEAQANTFVCTMLGRPATLEVFDKCVREHHLRNHLVTSILSRLSFDKAFDLLRLPAQNPKFQFVKSLFYKTVAQHRLCLSSDRLCAAPVLQVLEVEEIVNVRLLSKYITGLDGLQALRRETGCTPIPELQHLKVHPMSLGTGETDLNEHFLFHGAPPNVLGAICDAGFDPQRGGQSAGSMFGIASYFAPNVSKADMYTDNLASGRRFANNAVRHIIVARVALGNSCQVTQPQTWHRAPDGFDSAWASSRANGGCVDHDEVMIYHQQQALPLFLVKYRHCCHQQAAYPLLLCSQCSKRFW